MDYNYIVIIELHNNWQQKDSANIIKYNYKWFSLSVVCCFFLQHSFNIVCLSNLVLVMLVCTPWVLVKDWQDTKSFMTTFKTEPRGSLNGEVVLAPQSHTHTHSVLDCPLPWQVLAAGSLDTV